MTRTREGIQEEILSELSKQANAVGDKFNPLKKLLMRELRLQEEADWKGMAGSNDEQKMAAAVGNLATNAKLTPSEYRDYQFGQKWKTCDKPEATPLWAEFVEQFPKLMEESKGEKVTVEYAIKLGVELPSFITANADNGEYSQFSEPNASPKLAQKSKKEQDQHAAYNAFCQEIDYWDEDNLYLLFIEYLAGLDAEQFEIKAKNIEDRVIPEFIEQIINPICKKTGKRERDSDALSKSFAERRYQLQQLRENHQLIGLYQKAAYSEAKKIYDRAQSCIQPNPLLFQRYVEKINQIHSEFISVKEKLNNRSKINNYQYLVPSMGFGVMGGISIVLAIVIAVAVASIFASIPFGVIFIGAAALAVATGIVGYRFKQKADQNEKKVVNTASKNWPSAPSLKQACSTVMMATLLMCNPCYSGSSPDEAQSNNAPYNQPVDDDDDGDVDEMEMTSVSTGRVGSSNLR